MTDLRTLDELRADFGRSRFLAMPIAGTIAWTVAGVLGALIDHVGYASYALFLCTGLIFPLGLLVARFTGEDLLGKRSHNPLDRLFGLNILMANLAWGIAIPFWLEEPRSLPLGVGILAGLMWVPLSWMIEHWVGLFHGIARTVLIVGAWFLWPEHSFTVIPAVVVLVYAISIWALLRRPLPQPA